MAAPEQRVDERATVISGPGVDGHAGGLVDSDEVVVFVEDVEGNVFGLRFEGGTRGGGDVYDVTSADFVRVFGGSAVEENELRFNEFLDASSGELGILLGDETVEADAGLVSRDCELDRRM